MPNGHDYREQRHGPHDYGDDPHRTYDCKHKCGCSMGPSSSYGPTGVDPSGECPGNPLEGKGLGSPKADQDFVVRRRIRDLETRLDKADDTVRRTRPTKIQLAERGKVLEQENCDLRNNLLRIKQLATVAE